MKFSSSISFDSLIMPIFFIFFYDHRSASGSISGPEIAHPAICTGASGDLYWSLRETQVLICTEQQLNLSKVWRNVLLPWATDNLLSI